MAELGERNLVEEAAGDGEFPLHVEDVRVEGGKVLLRARRPAPTPAPPEG